MLPPGNGSSVNVQGATSAKKRWETGRRGLLGFFLRVSRGGPRRRRRSSSSIVPQRVFRWVLAYLGDPVCALK